MARNYAEARLADPASPGGAEYALARSLGDAAAKASRISLRGSFGSTSREVRRLRNAAAQKAASRRLEHLDQHSQALAIVSQGTADGATLQDMARRGVQLRAARRAMEEKEDHEAAMALAWFAEHKGPEILNNLEGAAGVMPAGILSPIPSVGEAAFAFTPDIAKSAADAHGLTSSLLPDGLGKALDDEWGKMHSTFMHKDCEQVPATPQPQRDDGVRFPHCRKVGFCVCTANGQALHKLQNAVLSKLKSVCRLGSRNRTLLAQGFVVLRLVQLGQPAGFDNTACEMWWHLGFVLFKPYAPVVHMLKRVPDPGELPAHGARSRIYLEVPFGHIAANM